MLVINDIREKKDEIIARLKVKNIDAQEAINKILELDETRRKLQAQLDQQLAELNKISKAIGQLMKEGKHAEAETAKNRTAELKTLNKDIESELANAADELNRLLISLPNTPNVNVPQGKSAEDNKTVFSHGTPPPPSADMLPHWELTKKYDIIDFELGVKITGAGFPVYKGKGARLQRALINFFLDMAVKAGYTEIQPPYMVNEDSGYGTGQLPDKDGQMYLATEDRLYLIPTAEVPVTNIYRNVILSEKDFPVKNVAYSACFRREAGSYGKDVRGLNRLHQFDKVEIVQLQHPSKSYETLEEMKEYVAGLLKSLGLPFRILALCGGDMSFTSAFTYDLEVFSAGQQRWLEVSSVSNFESFQANRLKLRFKDEAGKSQLAHTLNGSALALPRIMAALIENYQTPAGIKVPDVLVPYTGFDLIN